MCNRKPNQVKQGEMKLVIEISDCVKDGNLEHWILPRIIPINEREGLSAYDKSQTKKIARLIDLMDVIEKSINDFYQNDSISSPSFPINTSGEPGTK